MSRYIDAEKLIAEIERRKDKYDPHWTNAGRELEELISFTKSLQQEQTQVADASKMERLNVDNLHEWSMRYAPDIRDAIEATAYHFWNLAINSRKEQPESELEKAARYVYESWMGGTMDDVRRDMVELGKVLNARKEK